MRDADKAYAERGMERHDPDPAEEVFASVKALIVVLGVVASAVTLLSFLIWGKF